MTLALVRVLRSVLAEIATLEAQIREELKLHPDGFIFRSLPRSGCVRAAALLAEIGDCRARFPSPESPGCSGRRCPSTRRSGKHTAVTFRWACDKKLRDAVIDFAQELPARQRVGSPPLPPASSTRSHPPPRKSRARPSVGPRDLALLARPRRL